jgi:penicillin amidase
VISGFNKFIAWGVTNVAHDVKDWYAVKWTDASKKFYYVDDKKMPVKIIYDTIKIRGKAPLIDTLRYTHLGPVAKNVNGTDFVLYWLANEPGHEPLTFLKLMRGKNYNDYLDAIQNFGCPAQNLVFASNNGDIALWTQGKLPIRRPEQGKFVMDGSISFNQYEGFIPQNQIPHEYNPKKGFVESANQHSVRPDYPYYTYGYFEEYRGRYLHTQLASSQNVKAEEMQLLQKSNYGQKAADFLPHMIKYLKKGSLSKEELELLAKLKNWNYQYLAAEISPAIFEDWFYNFNEAVYDEIKHAQSKGIDLVYPDEWHLLNLIKRDTGNIIFDKINTDNKEDLSEILTSSFKTTGKTIPRKDNKVLTWGEMKSTALMHLARIKEFGIFNLNVDGSYHALNAVSNRYDFEASRKKGNSVHKEKSSSGPSWKMVVEMSDVPKASTIYPGGQSGNPGSHYYSNMVNDWASGKYYDAWYMLSPDESNKKAILTQKIYN